MFVRTQRKVRAERKCLTRQASGGGGVTVRRGQASEPTDDRTRPLRGGELVVVAINGLLALPFVVQILLRAGEENAARTDRLAQSLGMRGLARLRILTLPALARPLGLAMALAGARGLVAEHDAMRTGQEHWLEDHAGRDFTLFGATVGIVGFGQIAQELARLLKPFGVLLLAHDPWLPASVAAEYNVKLLSLDDVMARARCLFVAAVPTTENRHLLNARNLALMPKGALLVLLSRAHLVDFDALIARVDAGDIRAAVDVFPFEPVSADDPVRTNPGLILSPHRAAAVEGGRQLIGEMIRDDIFAWMTDDPKRRLGVADHKRIAALAGVGDATQTSSMALDRQG